MKRGDRVRMTEAFKKRMRVSSSAHVDEFAECVGIVQGPMDFNNCLPEDPEYLLTKLGPEVDVRWQPSNLRYGYLPEELELVL